MDVFSEEAKQQVLGNLFDLATEPKSANVSAIKLYLDLMGEQTPSESLTVDQAMTILRMAQQQSDLPSKQTDLEAEQKVES